MSNRISPWRIALAWAVTAAAVQFPLRASAVEADWLPLQVGNRWVYEVHRDHTYQPENASIDRVFHVGRSVQIAEPGDEPATKSVKIIDTTTLQPTQAGSQEETHSSLTMSFDDGLWMLGSSETLADGSTREIAFKPPLRMLSTTTIGESWKVGTFRDGDLSVELRGEVVGADKGDAPCEACLKIRYGGPIAGKVPIFQGSAAVESGQLERIVWLKRGVGIVREVTTVESKLRLPDGTLAKTIAVLKLRLLEHRVAK